jgi:hypothetical protein
MSTSSECLLCHEEVGASDSELSVCCDCAVATLPGVIARAVIAEPDGSCDFANLSAALSQIEANYWKEAAFILHEHVEDDDDDDGDTHPPEPCCN